VSNARFISWRENLAFALAAMRIQKLRSFLTLLGVVAGVATVVAMVSYVVGFNNHVTQAFTAFGTDLVQFQKYAIRFGQKTVPEDQRTRRDLTLEAAMALKRQATLAAAVSPERYHYTPRVSNGTLEAQTPTLFGAGPDYPEANVHFVQDGRFITEADVNRGARVCVIGRDIADSLFPLRDPIDQELKINQRSYRIVGVFEKKDASLGASLNAFVAVPITTFDEQFPEIRNGGGDNLHIATVPRRAEDVERLIDEEIAILRRQRGLRPNQPDDFEVVTSSSKLETLRQITNRVAAAMIVIAAIALVVGGVGVMNIMLVNVTQRTREIGLRKAVGATRQDIAVQFLIEAVTLTAVGGAVGIAVGFGAASAARVFFGFHAQTPLWSVALGFGVSTGVGVLFGLGPALKAARRGPGEALRYE